MKVLIVLAHHRENSLVHSVKNKFEKGLTDSGHQVTTLDLFKVGFDPVLREEDEPHYDQVEQKFSPEVHEEMERINQHDAIVFVFPMYWSNMPAIMKGYLDRVWNLGFAYSYLSPNTMKVKKVFFMTTTGASEEIFIKRDHIKFINHYFNNVVAGYCKVENSRVKIFDDAHNEEFVINNHLPQAYQEGLDFDKW
jgi:putative NADPH-quinone reductase